MSEHTPHPEPKPTHTPGDPGFHHIQITGKNPQAFAGARDKLLAWFNQLLDQQLDPIAGTTARDETQEFIHESLNFLKAKLKKADFENEKIQAETLERFTASKENLAKARKASAEAHALELENMIREMKIKLALTKVIVLQDKGEAAVLFGRDIDALLNAIKEIEGVKALPRGE